MEDNLATGSGETAWDSVQEILIEDNLSTMPSELLVSNSSAKSLESSVKPTIATCIDIVYNEMRDVMEEM